MVEEIERLHHSAVGLVLHKEYKNDRGIYQTAQFFASGTLIDPQVVLTAAHCLKDTLSVSVVLDELIPQDVNSIPIRSRKFFSHPNYENTDTRLDFGLIFLSEPVESPLQCPVIESFSTRLPETYIRYGYGGRNGENRRFRAEMRFSMETKSGFVLSEDTTGVYGDSGGPVLIIHEDQLKLIGIHTGREKDPETRELKDRSFMTPLTPALQVWITRMLNENRFKKQPHP